MTVILKTDFNTCITIPYIQRYEGVRNMSVLSWQWYDTKGKRNDYRETVFCFDNKRVYFYDDNDTVETLISKVLTGELQTGGVLDLTDFDCVPSRVNPPRGFRKVEKIV